MNRAIPEWSPHLRSLICWPGRTEVWADLIDEARAEYARLIHLLLEFEPVTVFVNPGQLAQATAAVGTHSTLDVVELPFDDSWLRDSGPVFCENEGVLTAAHFNFNAWGCKYVPHANDAAIGRRVADYLGVSSLDIGLTGEGGGITLARGDLFTTRSVLCNPNRNPRLSEADITNRLIEKLGVNRVHWLDAGLADDLDTDGHIDNLVFFVSDEHAAVLDVPPDHPDRGTCVGLHALLQTLGYRVTKIDGYRTSALEDARAPVSMLNTYIANGVLVVPVSVMGAAGDAIEQLQPLGAECGRAVRPFVCPVMAYGGGGVHCVTLGVPDLS